MTDAGLSVAQARALGAPTRRAILDQLAAATQPVAVTELTDHLGLNHNAVRKHLAQLVGAGIVIEEREPRTTPGRPRLVYRLAPGGPVGADQSYRRLAVLLATALATGENPVSIGRAAPHAGARASASGAVGVEALAARFAADGFEPSVRRRGRRAEITLGACPFADAAAIAPDTVCGLHLGLAQGAAGAIGGLEIEDLSAKDPRLAGCRLRVRET